MKRPIEPARAGIEIKRSTGKGDELAKEAATISKPRDISAQEREILGECCKWMDIISGTIVSELQHRQLIKETVENYINYVNRGWADFRKSVTEAGEYPCLEWIGAASTFCDNLGREYIDCLGGYGLYSAGIRHPKIVRAVQAQLQRNPLSSQELLDPLRGALSKLLAQITPGNL